MSRGGAHRVELDERRPCVVVSADEVFEVDVWQTHVVPLTSNLERAGLAGNVLLEATATGLTRASVAVPLGLELVDRAWLGDPVGRLPRPLIDAVDDGIRAILGV